MKVEEAKMLNNYSYGQKPIPAPVFTEQTIRPMTEADRIRAEMEEASKKMLEHKNFLQSIVPQKTVGPSTYVPAEEKLLDRPIGYTRDGKEDYVIHNVTPTDTLEGISLRYDVNKDLIRRANEFTGDEVYMKKELIIPFTSNIAKFNNAS